MICNMCYHYFKVSGKVLPPEEMAIVRNLSTGEIIGYVWEPHITEETTNDQDQDRGRPSCPEEEDQATYPTDPDAGSDGHRSDREEEDGVADMGILRKLLDWIHDKLCPCCPLECYCEPKSKEKK